MKVTQIVVGILSIQSIAHASDCMSAVNRLQQAVLTSSSARTHAADLFNDAKEANNHKLIATATAAQAAAEVFQLESIQSGLMAVNLNCTDK